MNPTYSAAAEEYREKVQAFLAEKLPPNWKGIGALTGDALEHFITEWRATLFSSGYLAPGWPVEFGGGGLSELEQVIIAEEFARAGV
ncbi:MAG: acyl-CoA dehydrogenase, partial [Actinobacteria bacterium]|nr:acyl-CoA dehydrogenase [Actinomycetota bacterium]